jgi:hypothetical protein
MSSRAGDRSQESGDRAGTFGVVTIVILYVLFMFGSIAVGAMIFGRR